MIWQDWQRNRLLQLAEQYAYDESTGHGMAAAKALCEFVEELAEAEYANGIDAGLDMAGVPE